jgi:hypothetical protein
VGDPDRVSTLGLALEHVGVVCILLGSAEGSPEKLAELHGTRLEMFLRRMVDTTVRGIVYEARGTVGRDLLSVGADRVQAVCDGSSIPYALLDADPEDQERWVYAAHEAVGRLLGASRAGSRPAQQ